MNKKNPSTSRGIIAKSKGILKFLGPGFVTGASDDDPSGIATYSQTGAQFGYNQAWTALFTLPFMIAIQEISTRIGVVTGKGIALVLKDQYPKSILVLIITLFFIANVINIAANLSAMAASIKLSIDIPFYLLIIGFAVFILALELFMSYKRYSKILKFLGCALFAYVITVFFIEINWSEALKRTIIPNLSYNMEYLLNIVAILGTTISPYLLIWQPTQEIEEQKNKKKNTPKTLKKIKIDTTIGMFFSNLIMFAIILISAVTLHDKGITQITELEQAANALKALAGSYTFLLFSVGIIGLGLLTIPILAGSAAYAISELFHWKTGLDKKPHNAYGFYGIIIVAMIIAILLSLTPIKPFQMLYYSAIINGIVAAPLMMFIMLTSQNKKIMGEKVNSWRSSILGWTITIIMMLSAIVLCSSWAMT